MVNKTVELKEDTRILLNLIKGKILLKNPDLKKLTDNDSIHKALENYYEVLSNE